MNEELETNLDESSKEETNSEESSVEEHEGGEESSGETNSEKPDYAKMFKDTQAALTQAKMEQAEMRGVLKGMQGQQEEAAYVDPVEAILADIDPNDTELDVVALIRQTLGAQTQEVAKVMRARDEYYKGELAKRDPGIYSIREQIEEKRESLGDAGSLFSDEQLAALVQADPDTAVTPQRAVGGKRAPVKKKAVDIRESPLYKEIYRDLPPMVEEKA